MYDQDWFLCFVKFVISMTMCAHISQKVWLEYKAGHTFTPPTNPWEMQNFFEDD